MSLQRTQKAAPLSFALSAKHKKLHMTKRKKKNQKLFLGHYAVAFMDLLGQQDFLRNLHSLPNPDDPQDMDATREHLKNTYGAVTGMRKFFNDSFEAYSRRKIDLSKLTTDQKKEFKELTNNPIKFHSFSDSVVIFMPLRTDTAKLPIRGIFGILGAAATTFTCCLAIGHPIRGGIDVGIGMEITKNEIYGPALSRAYTLESRIANYPRIVVGNELVRYLETTRDQEPKDIAAIVAKKTAERCIECLAVDDDGYPFVDYLGESYRRMFGEVIDVSVIQKAYSRVLNFTAKYQKEKNSKLAFRYTLLRNYFEDRLPLWEDLFSTEQ
jgi:hypothetical protein